MVPDNDKTEVVPRVFYVGVHANRLYEFGRNVVHIICVVVLPAIYVFFVFRVDIFDVQLYGKVLVGARG